MQQEYHWVYQPKEFKVEEHAITITTEPKTDYWQKTYYPFSLNNAPGYLQVRQGDYTYSTKVTFDCKKLYDQAGILLYIDADYWVKISFEYHDNTFGTIGVVVTNFGYSDWSYVKCDATIKSVFLRVSRRGPDFRVEYSLDNVEFSQLRMFHLHKQEDPKIGIYAASPLDSSFTAVFEQTQFSENIWQEFKL